MICKLAVNQIVFKFDFTFICFRQIRHFSHRKTLYLSSLLHRKQLKIYNANPISTYPVGYQIENEYYHSLMENISSYRDVVKRPTKDTLNLLEFDIKNTDDCKKFSDIFTTFLNATVESTEKKLDIGDRQFKCIVKSIVESLPTASDKQIFQTLACLSLWPNDFNVYWSQNYKLLWNSLDNECVLRLKSWTIRQKLLAAEYIFHLKLSRISKYNERMIEDLVFHRKNLSIQQVIQLMFYVNLQRNTPQNLLTPFESKWNNIMKEISIQELSIICLGYFKTQNKILEMSIVKNIASHVIKGISDADSFVITGCVKFLRKSLHSELVECYISVINQCVARIHQWGVTAAIHIALLSSEVFYYNPMLLDTVCEKIGKDISTSRLKDGTKLLLCLSLFNHFPKSEFHDVFLKEFLNPNRKEELTSYPRDLFYCLLSYAYLGHYPSDLLRKAFDPKHVDHCIKVHGISMMNPIAVLDFCVEIEAKDYIGPRIRPGILRVLRNQKGKLPSEETVNPSYQTRLTNSILKTLSELMGSYENVCVKHVLPHMFSPDVILRINPKDRSLPFSNILHNMSPEAIIKPPSDEIWVAFMICGKYCYLYKRQKLNGVNVMKRRQLMKLGYKVVVLPYYEVEEETPRRQYLEKQLKHLECNGLKINKCYKSLKQ